MSQARAHPAPEPGSAKRRQILDGARQVFAELGFERTSVDMIAARAGVSKATIYNHYEDKVGLFVACVSYDADEMRGRLCACMREPAGDVEQALQRLGEDILHVYLSPRVVALYRHIIAEAPRLPGLGQTIYDRGLGTIYDSVGAYLQRWDRSGALRIDDPRGAAVAFIALIQADLVTRARLAILPQPVDEPVREAVRRAVHTFVRAYAPSPRPVEPVPRSA